MEQLSSPSSYNICCKLIILPGQTESECCKCKGPASIPSMCGHWFMIIMMSVLSHFGLWFLSLILSGFEFVFMILYFNFAQFAFLGSISSCLDILDCIMISNLWDQVEDHAMPTLYVEIYLWKGKQLILFKLSNSLMCGHVVIYNHSMRRWWTAL